MREEEVSHQPPALERILQESAAINFRMASDALTGSLLSTLAATKPAGRFLELGTGTGVAAAWLLYGMDRESQFITVEDDPAVGEVAGRHLGCDQRVRFCLADGGEWLESYAGEEFDLIFADSWPGKYSHLEAALGLLKVGGIYVIDDMLPQANWPEGHGAKVDELTATLEKRSDLLLTKLRWSSGIIIAVKAGRA